MKTTRKETVTRTENMLSVCKELEQCSIIDSTVNNMDTNCVVSEGSITDTYKDLNAYLDGIRMYIEPYNQLD